MIFFFRFTDQNSELGWGPVHALHPWVKKVEEAVAKKAKDKLRIRIYPSQTLSKGKDNWIAESIGWVYGLAGKRAKAKAILREAQSRVERKQYVPSSAFAMLHLGLGDTDGFFRYLERGVGERDAILPWFKTFPPFKRLHSDPRFSNLLHSLGLQ
jgi:hypothetical protein